MASLATLDQIRGPNGRLMQFTAANGSADTSRDTFLQECLDQATSIINEELDTVLTAAAVGTQVVYGTGTVWLPLPLFTPASVTLVSTLAGYTVPDYVESGGALRTTDPTGIYSVPYYPQLAGAGYYGYGYGPDYTSGIRWQPGVPYTVHATYGATANDLVTARMCCLEIAVNLFRFGDSGGSGVVGVEGAGAVEVKNDYSPIVRRMLGYLKRRTGSPTASVW